MFTRCLLCRCTHTEDHVSTDVSIFSTFLSTYISLHFSFLLSFLFACAAVEDRVNELTYARTVYITIERVKNSSRKTLGEKKMFIARYLAAHMFGKRTLFPDDRNAHAIRKKVPQHASEDCEI